MKILVEMNEEEFAKYQSLLNGEFILKADYTKLSLHDYLYSIGYRLVNASHEKPGINSADHYSFLTFENGKNEIRCRLIIDPNDLVMMEELK